MNKVERIIISNRKAKFEYFILESYEAGIVLTGSEIKSLKAGNANLQDGYGFIKGNKVFLNGLHINPYKEASFLNHDPLREKILLLNKKEIRKISSKILEKGLTFIPLNVYIKNGIAKVEMGICKGKKLYDKRESTKERETELKINRLKKIKI